MTDETPANPTDPTPEPVVAQKRRPGRRVGLIVALVAVVLVAGAAVTVAMTRGGDADPAQAVRDYDQVFKKSDCDGFNDVTTSSFRDELGLTTCAKFDNNAKDASISSFRLQVTSSDVDGDTSSVRTRETFTTSTGEQSIMLVYTLVKQDGKWLVDKIAQDKSV